MNGKTNVGEQVPNIGFKPVYFINPTVGYGYIQIYPNLSEFIWIYLNLSVLLRCCGSVYSAWYIWASQYICKIHNALYPYPSNSIWKVSQNNFFVDRKMDWPHGIICTFEYEIDFNTIIGTCGKQI